MSLFENYKKYQEEMLDIIKKKNSDYSTIVDSYSNFRRCEQLGICSVETGILVRMTDKLARICNLVNKDPDVVGESIKDTLQDLSNYSMILASYIEDKQKEMKK